MFRGVSTLFIPAPTALELTADAYSDHREPYNPQANLAADYFSVCLKYLRSGGGWSLRAGISKPPALMK